jgi:hypothetical protein
MAREPRPTGGRVPDRTTQTKPFHEPLGSRVKSFAGRVGGDWIYLDA